MFSNAVSVDGNNDGTALVGNSNTVNDKSVRVEGNNSGVVNTGDHNVITIYSNAAYIPVSKLTEAEIKKIRKKLAEKFSKLPIHDSVHSLSIEDYQPLSLMKNRQSMSEEQFFEELTQKEGVELLVIGDIGSGKTTLMKWLIYTYLVEKKLAEYKAIFYIDLEKMDDKIEDLQSLLNAQYRHYIGKKVEFEFDEEKTLFIFDGLDKIKSQSQKDRFYEIQDAVTHQIIVSRNNSIDINQINHDGGILYVDGFKGVEELQQIGMEEELKKCEDENNSFANFVKKRFKIKNIAKRFEFVVFFTTKDMYKIFKNPLFLTYLSTIMTKSLKDFNKLLIFEQISQLLLLSYNINQFQNEQESHNKLLDISKKDMRLVAYKMHEQKKKYADIFIQNDVSQRDLTSILKFGFFKATACNSLHPRYYFINPLFKHCLVAEEISQEQMKIDCFIDEIIALFQITKNSSLSYTEMCKKINTNNKLDIFRLLNRKLHAETFSMLSKEMKEIFETWSLEAQIEFLYDGYYYPDDFKERLQLYRKLLEAKSLADEEGFYNLKNKLNILQKTPYY